MANVLYVAEKDEFTSMGSQMGKWVDQVLGSSFRHYSHADSWKPAINLCEFDAHYSVIVDLAGVAAPEIDLRVEEGVLVLTGERPMPDEACEGGEIRVHLMEIDHGHFYRAIRLPEEVDVDGIEAFYRNGYLWIRIPKNVRG